MDDIDEFLSPAKPAAKADDIDSFLAGAPSGPVNPRGRPSTTLPVEKRAAFDEALKQGQRARFAQQEGAPLGEGEGDFGAQAKARIATADPLTRTITKTVGGMADISGGVYGPLQRAAAAGDPEAARRLADFARSSEVLPDRFLGIPGIHVPKGEGAMRTGGEAALAALSVLGTGAGQFGKGAEIMAQGGKAVRAALAAPVATAAVSSLQAIPGAHVVTEALPEAAKAGVRALGASPGGQVEGAAGIAGRLVPALGAGLASGRVSPGLQSLLGETAAIEGMTGGGDVAQTLGLEPDSGAATLASIPGMMAGQYAAGAIESGLANRMSRANILGPLREVKADLEAQRTARKNAEAQAELDALKSHEEPQPVPGGPEHQEAILNEEIARQKAEAAKVAAAVGQLEPLAYTKAEDVTSPQRQKELKRLLKAQKSGEPIGVQPEEPPEGPAPEPAKPEPPAPPEGDSVADLWNQWTPEMRREYAGEKGQRWGTRWEMLTPEMQKKIQEAEAPPAAPGPVEGQAAPPRGAEAPQPPSAAEAPPAPATGGPQDIRPASPGLPLPKAEGPVAPWAIQSALIVNPKIGRGDVARIVRDAMREAGTLPADRVIGPNSPEVTKVWDNLILDGKIDADGNSLVKAELERMKAEKDAAAHRGAEAPAPVEAPKTTTSIGPALDIDKLIANQTLKIKGRTYRISPFRGKYQLLRDIPKSKMAEPVTGLLTPDELSTLIAGLREGKPLPAWPDIHEPGGAADAVAKMGDQELERMVTWDPNFVSKEVHEKLPMVQAAKEELAKRAARTIDVAPLDVKTAPPETPPAVRQEGTPPRPVKQEVADLVDRYDRGDKDIQTIGDLVDRVDDLAESGPLRKAVDDYRDAADEDFSEWGMRGDMDAEETKFLKRIDRYLKNKDLPPPETPPSPPKPPETPPANEEPIWRKDPSKMSPAELKEAMKPSNLLKGEIDRVERGEVGKSAAPKTLRAPKAPPSLGWQEGAVYSGPGNVTDRIVGIVRDEAGNEVGVRVERSRPGMPTEEVVHRTPFSKRDWRMTEPPPKSPTTPPANALSGPPVPSQEVPPSVPSPGATRGEPAPKAKKGPAFKLWEAALRRSGKVTVKGTKIEILQPESERGYKVLVDGNEVFSGDAPAAFDRADAEIRKASGPTLGALGALEEVPDHIKWRAIRSLGGAAAGFTYATLSNTSDDPEEVAKRRALYTAIGLMLGAGTPGWASLMSGARKGVGLIPEGVRKQFRQGVTGSEEWRRMESQKDAGKYLASQIAHNFPDIAGDKNLEFDAVAQMAGEHGYKDLAPSFYAAVEKQFGNARAEATRNAVQQYRDTSAILTRQQVANETLSEDSATEYQNGWAKRLMADVKEAKSQSYPPGRGSQVRPRVEPKMLRESDAHGLRLDHVSEDDVSSILARSGAKDPYRTPYGTRNQDGNAVVLKWEPTEEGQFQKDLFFEGLQKWIAANPRRRWRGIDYYVKSDFSPMDRAERFAHGEVTNPKAVAALSLESQTRDVAVGNLMSDLAGSATAQIPVSEKGIPLHKDGDTFTAEDGKQYTVVPKDQSWGKLRGKALAKEWYDPLVELKEGDAPRDAYWNALKGTFKGVKIATFGGLLRNFFGNPIQAFWAKGLPSTPEEWRLFRGVMRDFLRAAKTGDHRPIQGHLTSAQVQLHPRDMTGNPEANAILERIAEAGSNAERAAYARRGRLHGEIASFGALSEGHGKIPGPAIAAAGGAAAGALYGLAQGDDWETVGKRALWGAAGGAALNLPLRAIRDNYGLVDAAWKAAVARIHQSRGVDPMESHRLIRERMQDFEHSTSAERLISGGTGGATGAVITMTVNPFVKWYTQLLRNFKNTAAEDPGHAAIGFMAVPIVEALAVGLPAALGYMVFGSKEERRAAEETHPGSVYLGSRKAGADLTNVAIMEGIRQDTAAMLRGDTGAAKDVLSNILSSPANVIANASSILSNENPKDLRGFPLRKAGQSKLGAIAQQFMGAGSSPVMPNIGPSIRGTEEALTQDYKPGRTPRETEPVREVGRLLSGIPLREYDANQQRRNLGGRFRAEMNDALAEFRRAMGDVSIRTDPDKRRKALLAMQARMKAARAQYQEDSKRMLPQPVGAK